MQKQLTLTIVEELVQPPLTQRDLYEGYRTMAADCVREAEAAEWAESTCGEIVHEEG